MSNTRNLADLLDTSGDIKSAALDNVTPTTSASDLTSGTLAGARLANNTIDSAHITAGAVDDAHISGLAATKLTGSIATARLGSGTASSTTFLRGDGSWQVVSVPKLDAPTITGTLAVGESGTVTHTISNWSDDVSYTITPTNCTVGAINTSGEFVITHTSGTPSYTILATTASLGLDDSTLVTKNLTLNLSAPTLSSPANAATSTNVVYTITSTSTNDDKLILDIGSSNFTYGSVSVGTASKVGNTVECIGFTTNNPAVTIQFTAQATYSITAKAVDTGGTYGDSASSSADSLGIANNYNIDYLVVGGGGAGKGPYYAGGGGAGGYRNSYNSETSGGNSSSETAFGCTGLTQYTVTVGAGGAAGTGSGSNSVFGTITSQGGGLSNHQGAGNGTSGGSGGGAHHGYSGGAGTSGQGFAGGGGSGNTGGAGGGGGASGSGGTNTGGQSGGGKSGGTGGNGLSSSITGSAVTRAGGASGASHAGITTHTAGGSGGGGTGGDLNSDATSGTVNTGGGGGGACHASGGPNPGAGGSGVVILRMATSNYSGTTTGSPTVSTSGSDTILVFNSSGTYTA